MNNMQPSEEALLTGVSVGSFRVDGVPTSGDMITLGVAGLGMAIYTVQPGDIAAPTNGSATFQVALGASLAFNASFAATGYQAVAVQPADLIVAPMFTSYFAEIIVVSPASAVFALTASRTGTTNVFPDSQGVPCPVQATVNNVTVYGYLPLLDALDIQAAANANLSLKYTKADVVDFRRDEVRARNQLYEMYRAKFARLMGGEQYIKLINRSTGGGAGATA